MPAIYAHDRFGQDVIESLSGSVKELVEVNRTAFDIGLQGPDLFFYYFPALPNDARKIGGRIHQMSGKQFFTRCAVVMRKDPSDTALSYLMGSVCHYVLDCSVHPLVFAECEKGKYIHSEVEMSFDRFLMEKDDVDPLTVPAGSNLVTEELSDLSEEISRFYAPVTPFMIEKAVYSASLCQRLLLAPTKEKRKLISSVLTLAGSEKRSFYGHVMSEKPIEDLAGPDEKMTEKYDEALLSAADRMEDVLLLIYQKKMLGPEFDLNYNGEVVS